MRLIIATLVGLLLSVSSVITAIGAPDMDPNIVLEKIGDKKVQLRFLEVPEGKITVTFKNERKNVIFKDIIDTDKIFKKNYDLSELDLGDYQIEVYTSALGEINKFDVKLGKEKSSTRYFAKVKKMDGENVALLVKAFGAEKSHVKLYDKGRLVFEEDFTGEDFGKVFKFQKFNSLKDITFELSDDNGYTKYISVL